MPIDEKTRLDIRQWFSERMSPQMADAMMELVPNLDHEELATKQVVRNSEVALRADMADLRSELHADMADLRADFAELRADMAEGFRRQQTWLVGSIVAGFSVFAGLERLLASI